MLQLTFSTSNFASPTINYGFPGAFPSTRTASGIHQRYGLGLGAGQVTLPVRFESVSNLAEFGAFCVAFIDVVSGAETDAAYRHKVTTMRFSRVADWVRSWALYDFIAFINVFV